MTRSVYDAIVEPDGRPRGRHPAVAASRTCRSRRRASRSPSSRRRLVGELDAHFRLKDELEPIREQYPNIVIDCPPALGLLTVNALVAATHLLIPIQSSYFALEGTDDLLETIEKVRAAAEPGAADSRRRHHDARQADGAGARHPGADRQGVRRQGLQDRDHQERPARGEPGLQGIDFHVRARLDAARPSTTACARRSSTVPKRGLPDTLRMRHDEHYVEALAALGRRADRPAWCRSTSSTRTRTSRARSWATCPS